MCLREFPTRPEANRPAQPQTLARVLKFRLQNLEIDIILSKQRKTKALIRWRGSAPLLFAYDIRLIFSWPSSIGNGLLQIYIVPKKSMLGICNNGPFYSQLLFFICNFQIDIQLWCCKPSSQVLLVLLF